MKNIQLYLARPHTFRKLLAILLSVVCVASSLMAVFPQVLASGTPNEEFNVHSVYTQDFEALESVKGWYNATPYNATYSTTTEKANGGTKSLKVDILNTNFGPYFKFTDENILVNAGDKVVVSGYYYCTRTSGTATYSVRLATTASNLGKRVEQSNTFALTYDAWNYMEMETTISEMEAGANYLGFHITKNGAKASTASIYFDDLKVTIIPAGNSYVKLDNYDANGNYEILSGTANSSVELSAPEKADYIFAGWKNGDVDYTDSTVTLDGTVTTLTAQWIKSVYTQDFEGEFTVQGANGRGTISVTDEKSCTGNKSLKYNITSASTYAGDTVAKLKDSENKDITVHTGDKVVLSFKYLHETAFSGATFKYGFNDGNGVAGSNFKGLTSFTTTASSEWQMATVEITVGETYNNHVLSLDVWRSGSGTREGIIYVDDLMVTVIPEGYSCVILKDYYENGDSRQLIGKTGSAVELPTPEKEGYTFTGWNNGDASYAATTVVLDGTVTALTAQWFKPEYTEDFEALESVKGWYNASPYNATYSTTTEKANGGTKSLKVDILDTHYGPYFKFTDEDILVNAGDKVVVSGYYYCTRTSGTATYSVRLATTASNLGKRVEQSNTFALTYDAWNYMEMETTISEMEAGANYLGFHITKSGAKASTASIYLDDLKVTIIPAGTHLTLKNTDAEGKSETITGDKNQVITLPTLEKEGYTFMGWKNGEEDYTATTVTLGTVTTLTARWYKPEYIQDFENEFTVESLVTYGNRTDGHEVTSEKAHSGNKSLKFNLTDSITASQTALIKLKGIDNKNVTVNTGDKLIVTFYILNENGPAGLSLRPYLVSSNWSTRNHVASGSCGSSSEWQKISIEVPAATAAQDSFVLALGTWRYGNSSGTIYIDDLKVSVVPEGHSYVRLDNTDGDGGCEFISGKNGSTVNLPMLARDGYVFRGWKNGSESYTASTVTLDGTITSLTAQWFKPEYTQDFENEFTVQSLVTYGNKTDGHEVTSEKAHTGNKSLKFNLTDPITASQTALIKIKGSDNKNVTVNTGDKLIVTFYVLNENGPAGLSLRPYLVSSNWSTRNHVASKSCGRSKEWQKITLEVPAATAAQDSFVLALGTWRYGNSSGTIYIDDIKVTVIPEGYSYVRLDNYDGNGDCAFLSGANGSSVDLPTPQIDGYEFSGWRNGADKYTASSVVLDGSIKSLTARWFKGEYTQDFEGEYTVQSLITYGNKTDGHEVTSEKAHTGNKSLKFNLTDPITASATALIKISDSNNKNIKVNSGEKLIVSFYALTENAPSGLSFRGYVVESDYNPRVSKGTASCKKSSEWQKVTIAIPDIADEEDAYVLALGTWRYGNSSGVIYIDDITVTVIPEDESYVFLSNSDGDDGRDFLAGKKGSALNMPSPEKEGFVFTGWFKDSAYTTPFTETTYPEKSITVYGGWKVYQPGNQWHIDFENYDEFIDSSRVASCYSVDSTVSHDGSKALKCDYPGKVWSRAMLTYDNERPFVVEPGATYVISYWTYTVSQDQWLGIKAIRFNTSSIKATSSGAKRQSNPNNVAGKEQYIYYNSPFDKWVKHTSIFTVSDDIGYNNALHLSVNGSANDTSSGAQVIYFDDMTITKLDEGNSFIYYYTNDDEQSNYIVQGKPGQKVKAYTPKNKTNCVFDGWFKDSAYTEEASDKDLTVIPEQGIAVYASQVRVKYVQDFENYSPGYGPVERDHELYSSAVADFNIKNVHSGKYSMHRIGNFNQGKAFIPFYSSNDKLEFEKEYVLVFWMKVDSYSPLDDVLEIIHINSGNFTRSVDSSASYEEVLNLSNCKIGEWQQYTFTFTNINSTIAFRTPPQANVFIDDVSIYLKGYEHMDNEIDEENAIVIEPIKKAPTVVSPDSNTNGDKNEDKDANANNSSNAQKQSSNILLIVCISVAALLLIGSALVIIVIRKKKLKKGGKA